MAYKTNYIGDKAVVFFKRILAGEVSPEEGRAVESLNLSGIFHSRESDIFSDTKTQNIDWQTILPNLRSLDLSLNHLRRLPDWVGQLSGLASLNIGINRLTALPEWLGNLSCLTSLDVSGNDFTDLPESLEKLTALRTLDLSYLTLDELPPALVMKWLDSGFSFRIDERFSDSKTIFLLNTTLLNQDIELFLSNDREKIRAYCLAALAAKKEKKIVCNEGKLIFLGDGEAGKTYTIKRILQENDDEEITTSETLGVDICPWKTAGTPYTFKIWDFGGQEILYSLHRCFLTDECLYVVVIRERATSLPSTEQARFWLNIIKTYAPKSKVLIAVNIEEKTDICDMSYINMAALHDEFPELIAENDIALPYCAVRKVGDRFAQLKEAVFERATELDTLRRELTPGEYTVKKLLEESKEDVIQGEVYEKYCSDAGITGLNQGIFLNWLKNLGVCFKYEAHSDLRVLNPLWITRAAYAIIRKSQENGEKIREDMQRGFSPDGYNTGHGIISHASILNIIKEEGAYDYSHIPYIMDVLRQHGLSYHLGEDREFLPALCPEGSVSKEKYQGYKRKLELERNYTYLSASVIYNLMVSLRNLLDKQECYKNEFLVQHELTEGLCCVIRFSGSSEKTVKITAYDMTGDHRPWTMIQFICTKLDIITDRILPERETIIYEPNERTEAEIDRSFLEAAIDSHLQIVQAKNRKAHNRVIILNVSELADVIGLNEAENILKRLNDLSDKVDTVKVTNEAILGFSILNDSRVRQIQDGIQKLGDKEEDFRKHLIEVIQNSQDETISAIAEEIEEQNTEGIIKRITNFSSSVSESLIATILVELAKYIGEV